MPRFPSWPRIYCGKSLFSIFFTSTSFQKWNPYYQPWIRDIVSDIKIIQLAMNCTILEKKRDGFRGSFPGLKKTENWLKCSEAENNFMNRFVRRYCDPSFLNWLLARRRGIAPFPSPEIFPNEPGKSLLEHLRNISRRTDVLEDSCRKKWET